MPYSIFLDKGKIEDVKFIRREVDTLVKAGNHTLCQLFKLKTGWSVCVLGEVPQGAARGVGGFKSRYSALEYCLKIHKLTCDRYNN